MEWCSVGDPKYYSPSRYMYRMLASRYQQLRTVILAPKILFMPVGGNVSNFIGVCCIGL